MATCANWRASFTLFSFNNIWTWKKKLKKSIWSQWSCFLVIIERKRAQVPKRLVLSWVFYSDFVPDPKWVDMHRATFTFSLFHISGLHPDTNIFHKNGLDPCNINIDLPQGNLIRFLTSWYSKRREAAERTSEREKLAFKQTGMNVYLQHTNEYLFFKGKLHQTVDFSWRTNKHLVVVIQQTFSPLTKPSQHG